MYKTVARLSTAQKTEKVQFHRTLNARNFAWSVAADYIYWMSCSTSEENRKTIENQICGCDLAGPLVVDAELLYSDPTATRLQRSAASLLTALFGLYYMTILCTNVLNLVGTHAMNKGLGAWNLNKLVPRNNPGRRSKACLGCCRSLIHANPRCELHDVWQAEKG